jgi:methylmalonyl-CoA mutase
MVSIDAEGTTVDATPKTAWQAIAARETARLPGHSLVWSTAEGIDLDPLYTEEDVLHLANAKTLPGMHPFLRGIRATMYAGRPWTLRQYAGFSTAEETNRFFKQCLAGGQTALSVAFDLATHRGYDSDHPRVIGDVGKAGVAVDSVEDVIALFENIPLEHTSVSMTMNGAVLPIFACYVVAAEEQGADLSKLAGTIQNDILKEFMVRNTFIYPPKASMRITADVIEYASKRMPKFNPISISGYHMHEAGASADLELAFTIADGLEYVRAAVQRGLDVDEFAPRLSFFFAVGMNFFVEIAKLRAARQLWAQLMREHFAPKRPESMMLRMHCQTSGVSLTEQDPFNNLARTAIEALAAALGGTQSMHTNSFDEATALPSDFAARLARNTQLILMHETGITHAIDPLGGSYYVETLTDRLVQRAMSTIKEVESLGGMTRAVEVGLPKLRIEEAAARRQARIDAGLDVIVGVNKYRVADDRPVEPRVVDTAAVRDAQIARLARLKHGRNQAGVDAALAALTGAASDGRNLLPFAVDAVRRRATVGEVSAALEKVFGRYELEPTVIRGVYGRLQSDDSDWHEVRRRVHAFESRHGRKPRILVAKLGQDGHDRGAKIIATAFADAGFDVDLGSLFQTPDEVAQQAVDNDVHVVGISSQAGGHGVLVPQLLGVLRRMGANSIRVVCGGVIPKEDHEALSACGVCAVFGPGTPVPEAALRVLMVLESDDDAQRA